MKLKYYLRGLGIGIVLTTLILFIFRMVNPISNEEVIKRAEKLGMVMTEAESLIPSHPTNTDSETSETDSKETAKEETSPVETESSTAETPTTEAPTTETPTTIAPTTETPTTEAPTTEAPTTEAPTTEPTFFTYELEITNSMGSETVANILARAGIVDDAVRFNDFLCYNGYSEIILSDKFIIRSDMSYEQIARLICGR